MNLSKSGITSFTCLNKHQTLNVFNGDKYWKENEREDFLQRISRATDKNYAEEGFYQAYN